MKRELAIESPYVYIIKSMYVNTDVSFRCMHIRERQSGREIDETEKEKENREKKREGVYLVKENNKI